jgi:hypothetical protein
LLDQEWRQWTEQVSEDGGNGLHDCNEPRT